MYMSHFQDFISVPLDTFHPYPVRFSVFAHLVQVIYIGVKTVNWTLVWTKQLETTWKGGVVCFQADSAAICRGWESKADPPQDSVYEPRQALVMINQQLWKQNNNREEHTVYAHQHECRDFLQYMDKSSNTL